MSVCWRNLSTYTCATTKQEGLQAEYLKMRSTYCRMLTGGGLKPWNIVTTSLICVFSIRISFFWTDLSRSEERSIKTLGVLKTPFLDSLSPKVWYISNSVLPVSGERASISEMSCIELKPISSLSPKESNLTNFLFQDNFYSFSKILKCHFIF